MKFFSLFLLNVLWICTAYAQSTPNTKNFNLEKGAAIQGYDPVAYFTENKAIKGTKQFSATVEGVPYYFATAQNKATFLTDPKKYEPQYGGWCAYAMGLDGSKVSIDPATFKVLNGKLYLFYHTRSTNTLTKWNADENHLKTKADKNWLKITNK